ncbi:nodulin MtN21 /EamA-like transporter family protein [Striga asiatica]|uniref:Nodulin MtN21 /EamA-like transporter family protein n=1 Tax=Striga asiatica TaxID=4170 RepID=A0A5A7QFY1_STRAF|nr:nodulin MtN21 /EamA-like transporter family protein [Striga asiatica]
MLCRISRCLQSCAFNIGVSKVVYPVYRNIIALLLLGPFTYFIEKSLTFSLLAQIAANQGFYILGTSPTFASAMQNSMPATIFIMASALRLEQVNIARIDGLAKILGTPESVEGATIITLYKGPSILNKASETSNSFEEGVVMPSNKVQNWTWGCIFLQGSYSEEVSSKALTNIIHIIFWLNPVPGSFLRKEPKALANPIWGRDTNNLICWSNIFRSSNISTVKAINLSKN